MTVHRERINLPTKGKQDMSDISAEVQTVISRSKIKTGICHIFNVGSTGVIGAIEFEPGLKKDFPEIMRSLVPPNLLYSHEQTWHDGNGHSHLQASILGPEITVPVENGRLLTGNWQQIFHYEADIKPRRREIVITIIGEE